jgi:soluble lytic murein transglycosylase
MEFPAVARIVELNYHREYMAAQSEWYKLLEDTVDRRQQQDLALLATEHGWYRMAIDAATRAEAWDALDQRFPMAYQDVFRRHAATRRVTSTELMSIARRESAFFPEAQSPVGARGLMQIMPATAQAVAASLQQPHSQADLFNVEHNVLLGSAYYRQLLDRFDGNRIFALAAYNAGPHRVDRWRNQAGQGLPVELWVETIPYQETRNYVQAVLSYNVVFQYLQGDKQALLTSRERQASY